MIQLGYVHDGVVVPEEPAALPDGATVRIEMIEAGSPLSRLPRTGGQWRGRVQISDGFDELPPDIADAVGMNPS